MSDQIFIVVWKDRHIDDTITVHRTRAGADRQLEIHMTDNADDDNPWVEYGANGSWIRIVHGHDDGPRGHIEVSVLK